MGALAGCDAAGCRSGSHWNRVPLTRVPESMLVPGVSPEPKLAPDTSGAAAGGAISRALPSAAARPERLKARTRSAWAVVASPWARWKRGDSNTRGQQSSELI